MNEQDYHDLVPAYVLDTLDSDEAAALEARIDQDAHLRDTVQQYRTLVGELALAVPPVEPEAVPSVAPVASTAPSVVARRGRLLRLVAPLTAAAALVVALVTGLQLRDAREQLQLAQAERVQLDQDLEQARRELTALQQQQEALNASLQTARSEKEQLASELLRAQQTATALEGQVMVAERLTSFLAAPDIASRDLRGTPDATRARGTMYMRPGQRDAVVLVSGLPPLPNGQSYQFWLAEGQVQFNAGALAIDAEGTGRLVLRAPIEVNRFSQVMVTLEAQQPARTPSDTTVLFGNL
jgi:hypothetical protein